MPDSEKLSTSTIRTIALDRLKSIHLEEKPLSVPAPAQESYLFEDNHYVGVRFVAGEFSFEWKMGEANATLLRDGNQVETIPVAAPTTIRKAA